VWLPGCYTAESWIQEAEGELMVAIGSVMAILSSSYAHTWNSGATLVLGTCSA
jgi:hypothetical protein